MMDLEGERRLCSAIIPEGLSFNFWLREIVCFSKNTEASNCETGMMDFLRRTSLFLSMMILSRMFINFLFKVFFV